MTPGERWKWAKRNRLDAKLAVYDAIAAAEDAEMEYHYARFIFTATANECPTCDAPAGAYCAIFRREDGTYSAGRDSDSWRTDRLVALFLHPARTMTVEALAVAGAA